MLLAKDMGRVIDQGAYQGLIRGIQDLVGYDVVPLLLAHEAFPGVHAGPDPTLARDPNDLLHATRMAYERVGQEVFRLHGKSMRDRGDSSCRLNQGYYRGNIY